jgi:hypothetical protein
MVTDISTGETKVQGREGRLYTPEEVERAMERAATGDAKAQALLDDIDFENKHGIDVIDPMAMLHDCPECRAAMARGEKPVIIAGPELDALMAAYQREVGPERPRPWWKRKRKQRRRR